ncbi:MAG: hypothetical protein KBF82_02395 [Chitinophagaceae bacterium]|nr:hypothetical protein [Chitinophagaceae bacterium]MBP9102687.1 hypothetical protein [Chitinophagaceae bacterium]
MKNRNLTHHHEAAKIYRHYYKSSVNPLRLLKSVLAVFITGNGATANATYKRKR